MGSADRQPQFRVHVQRGPCCALQERPAHPSDSTTELKAATATALHVLCLSLPFYCVRACLRACLFIASLFLVVLFRDILALSRLSAGPSADVSSPHLAVSRHRHPPEASKRTETLARARGTRLTSHELDRRAGHARRGRRTKSLFWREKVGGLDLRGPREKKAGGPRVVTPCWGGYDFEILSGVGPAGTRPKKRIQSSKGAARAIGVVTR